MFVDPLQQSLATERYSALYSIPSQKATFASGIEQSKKSATRIIASAVLECRRASALRAHAGMDRSALRLTNGPMPLEATLPPAGAETASKKRTLIVVWGAAFLIVVALFAYYLTRPSEQSMTALIQKELPLGSTFNDVVSFLDRHHMLHRDNLVHAPGMSADNTISGFINPAWRFLSITGSLEARFKFSREGKLESYQVVENTSGLP